MNKRIKLGLDIAFYSIAFIGFLVILILVCNGFNFRIDNLVNYFASHRTTFFNGFFRVVTETGSVYALILLALLGLIVFKNRRIGLTLCANVGMSGIIALIFKYLIKRERPPFMLVEETGFSFPSAHALMTVAFYGLLIYFVIKFIKNRPAKIILSICLAVLSVVVCISRIYIGVHHTSDVLAGALLGISLVGVSILIFHILNIWAEKIKAKKQNNLQN